MGSPRRDACGMRTARSKSPSLFEGWLPGVTACEQIRYMILLGFRQQVDSPRMSAAYLDRLNPDQRRAVEHGVGPNGIAAKGTCVAISPRVVNEQTELADVLMRAFPWCAAWREELTKLFAAYVGAKQAQSVLDYDDLLLYWAAMLEEEATAADIAARFDHVLVDEYQDTNRLQSSILMALKPDGRGLAVVGDDAQSIYSFRAATVRNILDFPGQFSPKAEIVTLDRNYRSTQPILSAANGVIDLARERFTKNLWTERTSSAKPRLVAVRDEADQARFVVDGVLAARENGVALEAHAV